MGAKERRAHLELRFGDLAAVVQVQRGESVPDGLEQFVLQAPHGHVPGSQPAPPAARCV